MSARPGRAEHPEAAPYPPPPPPAPAPATQSADTRERVEGESLASSEEGKESGGLFVRDLVLGQPAQLSHRRRLRGPLRGGASLSFCLSLSRSLVSLVVTLRLCVSVSLLLCLSLSPSACLPACPVIRTVHVPSPYFFVGSRVAMRLCVTSEEERG